jgi:hypothetical protein
MSDPLPTYPLRLPRSLRAGVERFSKAEGTSINQFVSLAVAEKLAMLQAETFFEERRARADLKAFDKLMRRPGGEPPRGGDERESAPAATPAARKRKRTP